MHYSIMRPTSLQDATESNQDDPSAPPEPEPAPEPVVMPVVGDVVGFVNFMEPHIHRNDFPNRKIPASKDDLEYEVVPALVVGMADEPELAANGVNLQVFHNGPRAPQFARNVAYAPADERRPHTWHWTE